MKPFEVIALADRIRRAELLVPEGAVLQIAIPKEDWDATLEWVQQFEPVIMWPIRMREHITHLRIHGVEIVYL